MDNEKFWWLIGRYFGDGSLSSNKCLVDICCAIDEINEITDDTKTGITTTTLEHTIDFEKYKKMYGGESKIFKILLEELKKGTFSDCDEEFQYYCYQIISNLQQENHAGSF